ncbi:sugar phosphate isomerase/epimerase [Promicromonospora sp. AC04]|uniref:sugar phosphate isomerase/epimerase family protein n=1 Tax=Promicromonospora sp. AC04 TaxID=2135723 RepID=UPI000D345F06|nr:sugar phosphate isomerase/epimerase [Promicromonospora sp. AC04]PUB22780.1 sugar phosphate isomerase/epimerase [Promicromonospora sp. AC04]
MEPRTDVDRRNFLRLAGGTVAVGAASLAGAALAGSAAASTLTPTTAAATTAAGGGRVLVPPGNIGIQLYSIRDKVSSLGFRAVFERLSAIGYKEVEFAGYTQGQVGAITPQEIRQLLDDNDLRAVGSHRGISDFANNMELELDNAEILGMKHIGTAQAPTGDRTVAGYLAAAEQFNGFGAAARARGLKFYQHNHDGEFSFATDDPDVRLYDVFYDNTDPRTVFLEMDVFWAFVGQHRYPGFEPVDYIKRNPYRYPLLHLKDGQVNPESSAGYDMVEFGIGDLPYTEFLSALPGGGQRHGVWEQDNAATVPAPGYPADSFGNAQRSYVEVRSLRSKRC